jgi:hypothetical protein
MCSDCIGGISSIMKYRASSPAIDSALACGANNAKIATGANISQRE